MSKIWYKGKKSMGIIITSIGIGIILTVVVPIWGWVVAAGLALIYCGWQVMDHHRH